MSDNALIGELYNPDAFRLVHAKLYRQLVDRMLVIPNIHRWAIAGRYCQIRPPIGHYLEADAFPIIIGGRPLLGNPFFSYRQFLNCGLFPPYVALSCIDTPLEHCVDSLRKYTYRYLILRLFSS